MIKKSSFVVVVIVLMCGFVNSMEVTDVSRSDVAYPAIKYSITNGYLPLYSQNTFKPNKEITRRELALTIDTLIKQIKQKKISLTETEIQELNTLSKSFKTSYTDLESRFSRLDLNQKNSDVTLIQIQEEFARSEDRLKGELKSLKKQNNIMWIGVVLAAALGIVI